MAQDELQKKREEKVRKIREVEEEDLAQKRAENLGLPYINLETVHVKNEALRTIPEKRSHEGGLVAFDIVSHSPKSKAISVAVFDPSNQAAKETISELEKFGPVQIYIASRRTISEFQNNYAKLPKEREMLIGSINISDEFLERPQGQESIFEEIKKKVIKVQDNDVTELLKTLLAVAALIGASDIHIEPNEKGTAIRMRIDGVLHAVAEFSETTYKALRTRTKLLAEMLLNIQNRAQDGRFTIHLPEKSFEVRVSSVPSAFGENLSLRMLDPDKISIGMEELGIRQEDLTKFAEHLARPNGMIINTGPTGSGKTTTLYSFLKKKYSPGIKIITIEDPVEYHLDGIQQTQVNARKGYDFVNALKSVVRQDPDVILVGEIRDGDTATTAVNAALTGHLLFSTLHTNEAVGTIPRFRELGVEMNSLLSVLNLVIAQRLVRRLCPHCKAAYEPPQEEKEKINRGLAILSSKAKADIPDQIPNLYKPVGCPECWGLGYKGQVGIFEYFEPTKRMTDLILKQGTIEELREAAIGDGMIPLVIDGYLKVIAGITDLAEVERVAGEVKYISTIYEKVLAQQLMRGIKADQEELKRIAAAIKDQRSLGEFFLASGEPELLKSIMVAGSLARASDIHIEPQEKDFLVRFRVDGILYDMARLPIVLYPAIISSIKNISGMSEEIHNRIQEGRFRLFLPEEKRDIRASLIPGGFGETATLRILAAQVETIKFESLGIRKEIRPLIEKGLEKTNGIIFAAGPTSAGKTTTMYSLLTKLNKRGVKIITVEDPIEYALPGIIQTQVDSERGYTFAGALKALLRQNPNIILIGETRDDETANIAMQSALSGHLILSTVHATDSATAIARLRNLKVSNSEISSQVISILAQRLVRVLCEHCKKSRRATAEETKLVEDTLNGLSENWKKEFSKKWRPPFTVYDAPGCAQCQHTGFFGQTGLFEILIPDESLQKAIRDNQPVENLRKIAKEGGLLTLFEDGILKSLEGITTLEEVKRVFNL